MTTIPAPTADTDTVTATDVDTAVAAFTATDVANLIRRTNNTPATKPFVQKARGGEGTGTVGLYIEAVTHTSAGTPFTHMKFFVVDRHLYAYSRTVGDSRANWQRRETPALQRALTIVQAALNRDTVRMFGHPVLVELTSADLAQIEADGIPEARFRGEYRIQKDFGRYDFTMEIRSVGMPEVLTRALRKNTVA